MIAPIIRRGAHLYALSDPGASPTGMRLKLWQATVQSGPLSTSTDAVRVAQLFEAAGDLADAAREIVSTVNDGGAIAAEHVQALRVALEKAGRA